MLPKGIKTSGFPAVDATCRRLGLVFDPWQADLNRCLLAKGKDGLYAADTAVISIPRQVGKTWDVGAVVFALCVINPGLTVVWTAHRFKVSRETFDALRAVALTKPLAAHIDAADITTAAGNEQIKFRNGSRILFAARERGAVRGFSKVGILVLDEGQILTEHALSDLVPTMNQAENPLIVVMGTPPKPVDPGEVFTRLREEALSGESDGVLYVEFSAQSREPDSRDAWREANPSYPRRTPAKAILRMRKLLSDEDFVREALGIWDDQGGDRAFGPGVWGDGFAERDAMPTVRAVGIATTWNRAFSSIGAAGRDGSETWVWSSDRERKTGWVARRAKEIQDRHGCRVVVAGSGPSAALIPDLEREGVDVTIASAGDYMDACAAIYDKAHEKALRHRADDVLLNDSVGGAERKASGDRWRWDRQTQGAEVDSLEAVTLAAWGADMEDKPKGGWMVAL